MPTHDMIIANDTGAAVRADLNLALAALVANSISATAPATMYAGMWWFDTTANMLKIRNAANSAWLSLISSDFTTLAANVVASSLTSLGTIAALVAGTANLTGAFSFNSSSVFRAQTTSNVPSAGVTINDIIVDEVVQIGPDNHIILMVTRTTNSWAWFKLGAGTTIIQQGSTADFTVTKDNANTINVYLEGGVTKLQNKTAGTIAVGAALLAGLNA